MNTKTQQDFLQTPGKLPWRLECPKRNSKRGIVYDADGRLVCVAAIGNARQIVEMSSLHSQTAKRQANGGKMSATRP